MKLLGDEQHFVTANSKLYSVQDMQNVIAAIDSDNQPANRDETTSLAALIIGKYRMTGTPNGPVSDKDFKIYAIGLTEAFAKYPASVGMEAVDGGTGVPSKTPYWPKTYDIVSFCQALMDRRGSAKISAYRYINEAKRREVERQERESPPIDYVARKARVAEIIAAAKLKTMVSAN